MSRSVFIAGAIAGAMAVVGAAGPAGATEVQVKMQDQGAQGMMVFEPSTAKLKVGDTVRFIPVNPGHNAESIKDMLPPGAELVKGQMGKEVVVKFAKPGVYGFKCAPHWGFGMTFVAKVGDGKPNAEAAEAAASSAPGMAKKRLSAEFAAIK
jgi:pseudoazurin